MKEKSIISSFWFWLFIIGLLFILTAAVITGGTREVNGWIWGFFIAGCIFAVLGIVFALVSWSQNIKNVFEDPQYVSPQLNVSSTQPNFLSQNISSTQPNISFQSNQPNIQPNLPSPMGIPSKINLNIPQAQKGFATTGINLSTLAP